MFYLGMAFLAVWLLVTLYPHLTLVCQRRIDTEIRSLREEVEAAEREGNSGVGALQPVGVNGRTPEASDRLGAL